MSALAETAAPAAEPAEDAIVQVRDLTVRFVTREATVHAVNGVNFDLNAGEVLCILGESGSGKSVTLRALTRLLPSGRTRIAGTVRVAGMDVLSLSAKQLSDMRGDKVAMIFQEPMTALDPVYTIGEQISQAIMRHRGSSKSDAMKRALELLELVQIPSARRRLKSYPHELSGGLRQRAMISLALSCDPNVLLADEPTTALDATVQIQILLLLRSLQKELGMGVIFVTHDLGVAGEIADRIAVMYAGRFVETGPVRGILKAPAHPYTMGLMASTVHGHMKGRRLQTIEGSPPNLEQIPSGCSFAARCPYAVEECLAAMPDEFFPAPGRMARCIRLDEIPK